MRASACTILWRFLKLYWAFRETHPAESISARGSELLSRTLYYILCDMSLFTWRLIVGHYIPIHNVWIAQRCTSASTDSAFENAIVQELKLSGAASMMLLHKGHVLPFENLYVKWLILYWSFPLPASCCNWWFNLFLIWVTMTLLCYSCLLIRTFTNQVALTPFIQCKNRSSCMKG